MNNKEYIKTCSNCGGLQSYTTKNRLKCSIRENWKCNNCSSTHMKKIYSDEVVNEVVKLYKNGVSYSEVSMMMNIGRKNVKTILIEKNLWIEDRDKIKKEFSVDGAFHLDHKYSIIEGFKNNISPEIIGGIKNLEFIPWKENIKKRTKCSITINELINN